MQSPDPRQASGPTWIDTEREAAKTGLTHAISGTTSTSMNPSTLSMKTTFLAIDYVTTPLKSLRSYGVRSIRVFRKSLVEDAPVVLGGLCERCHVDPW